jgi:hypothetical protein
MYQSKTCLNVALAVQKPTAFQQFMVETAINCTMFASVTSRVALWTMDGFRALNLNPVTEHGVHRKTHHGRSRHD